MLSKTRQALEDGYRILLDWISGNKEKKFFFLNANKEMKLGIINMNTASFKEENINSTIRSIWIGQMNNDVERLSIGEHHGLWGAPVTVTSSISKIHPMSNHAKCIRCKDEIFMAGADRKDFVCYSCRN